MCCQICFYWEKERLSNQDALRSAKELLSSLGETGGDDELKRHYEEIISEARGKIAIERKEDYYD